MGQIARLRGQLEEAEEYYEQSLPLLRTVGDRRGQGEILTYLGQIAKDRGLLEKAKHYYEQSLPFEQAGKGGLRMDKRKGNA